MNAIIHRNYYWNNCNLQIALYDNRLEITSPGGLLPGVNFEKMRNGYSNPRNQAIVKAFTYMKIIRNDKHGIPYVCQELRNYGLKEPEFIDWDDAIRVNVYRRN